MQTAIIKRGHSQEIMLPKALLESVNLTDSDIVDIIAENGSIVIKKSKNKRRHIPLSERLKGWNGQPYDLTDEDAEWLNMETSGGEI